MRRKAISAIIAELMLLAVVVALGTVIYAFASSAFGNLGSGFAGLISSSGDSLSEKLVIEYVAFQPCPGQQNQQACVYVRNVGSLDSTVASIYVYDLTANSFVGSQTTTVTVLVGQFAPIGVSISNFNVVHGHAYRFVIATARGNSVTFNAVA